jgi:hypothetical protein
MGVSHIVSNKVNSRYLLKHLVDIRKGHPMKFPILAHIKKTPVRTLGHFFHCFLYGQELIFYVWIIAGLFVEALQYLQSIVSSPLHHKPTRGLGQVKDGSKYDYREENLEG